MRVYKLVGGSYWGGEFQHVPDNAPIPSGWTSVEPPNPVPEGMYAVLNGEMQFELTSVPPSSITPPSGPVRIDTPLFIMRFTPQERIALRDYAAAGEDYSKHVNDWLMILNDPRLAYVELGDPNLIVAMGMMVSLGLLTQERADIVMAP